MNRHGSLTRLECSPLGRTVLLLGKAVLLHRKAVLLHRKAVLMLLIAASLLLSACGGDKKTEGSQQSGAQQQAENSQQNGTGKPASNTGNEEQSALASNIEQMLGLSGQDPYAANTAIENTPSLLEYAKQLEKNGELKAAQAVYDLISKGGGGGTLIREGYEKYPVLRDSQDLDQLTGLFDNGKKGGAK